MVLAYVLVGLYTLVALAAAVQSFLAFKQSNHAPTKSSAKNGNQKVIAVVHACLLLCCLLEATHLLLPNAEVGVSVLLGLPPTTVFLCVVANITRDMLRVVLYQMARGEVQRPWTIFYLVVTLLSVLTVVTTILYMKLPFYL